MKERTAGVLLLAVGSFAATDVSAAGKAGTDEIVAAGNQGLEELHAHKVGELVAGLAGYAEWCGKNKLYAERADTYWLMLRFDPAHEGAHRGLGHKLKHDGSWEEVAPERAPRNHDAGALREAPAERAKAVEPFCADLVAALKAPEITAAERRRVLEDVFRVAPDHEAGHELVGEVRNEEGAWVLRETPASQERRAQIREVVRTAYESVAPVAESELEPREKELGLPLRGAVAGPLARVVGTVGSEELAATCRALHVAHDVFGELLGVEGSLHEDLTVFLLAPDEKQAFLAAHPAVTAEMRPFLATLESSGIQGTGDFASWSEDEARRRDAAVRFALGWMLEVAFGTTTREGWVYEGLGIYLTREIVGTRLSWFVQPSENRTSSEDTTLRARLLDSETNWMNEALAVLQREDRPALEGVLKKTTNELTLDDLLFAYVTAAYLLETRAPQGNAELLRGVGLGLPPAKAVEKTFSIPMEEFEGRVRRWLSERR